MKHAVTVAFAAAMALFGGPAAPAEHHQHSFSGAEKWAKVFDDPERDAWQKPDEVIRALKLAPDALVADVGSGTGYFAVRLARALPSGRVIGVDVEPDMVRYLGERIRREKLTNLDSPVGPPKHARIAPDAVKQELAKAGYGLLEEHAFLPHQYFLAFRPAAR